MKFHQHTRYVLKGLMGYHVFSKYNYKHMFSFLLFICIDVSYAVCMIEWSGYITVKHHMMSHYHKKVISAKFKYTSSHSAVSIHAPTQSTPVCPHNGVAHHSDDIVFCIVQTAVFQLNSACSGMCLLGLLSPPHLREECYNWWDINHKNQPIPGHRPWK